MRPSPHQPAGYASGVDPRLGNLSLGGYSGYAVHEDQGRGPAGGAPQAGRSAARMAAMAQRSGSGAAAALVW